MLSSRGPRGVGGVGFSWPRRGKPRHPALRPEPRDVPRREDILMLIDTGLGSGSDSDSVSESDYLVGRNPAMCILSHCHDALSSTGQRQACRFLSTISSATKRLQ